MQKFQRAAQAWERLLFTSGGLMALHKCYWWLITWDWVHGLPKPRESIRDHHHVTLSNGKDDVPVNITRLEMDEANVGLGLRLSPSGNQEQEVLFRRAQVEQMAQQLNPLILSADEAWIFYTSIYSSKTFILQNSHLCGNKIGKSFTAHARAGSSGKWVSIAI